MHKFMNLNERDLWTCNLQWHCESILYIGYIHIHTKILWSPASQQWFFIMDFMSNVKARWVGLLIVRKFRILNYDPIFIYILTIVLRSNSAIAILELSLPSTVAIPCIYIYIYIWRLRLYASFSYDLEEPMGRHFFFKWDRKETKVKEKV